MGRFVLGNPAPPEDKKPLAFGDYELLDEIARGGMGVVYRARQISLNRIVALKVVLHGPFASQEFRMRFRTEAEAVAGLRHPNIVAVYEAGEHDGNPFLAMEYVEGRNFADIVRDEPLPANRAAQYLQTIAEAVSHAHEAGVLHRDLKPSNILLDERDQPRITDFGLAKLLKSDAQLTTTGQVIGSPSHMPPEQALTNFRYVGPAGDIYSLGAMLYHLLTARPPFQGETLEEVLMQVAANEPVPPRQLNPSVPLDLQTICLKCLQKDYRQRYGSARELAEELGRFLNGKPIHARPVTWFEHAYRWCRRKPALASALGLAAMLLLIIAVGSPIVAVRLEGQRKLAEAARRREAGARARAEAAEQATRQQAFAALVSQARATIRGGEVGQRVQALQALKSAAAISNFIELRRDAFAALALPDLRFVSEFNYGQEYTMRRLDPAFERIALCKQDGPVEIRSFLDKKLLALLPATTNLPAFSDTRWRRDGRFLAVKRDRDSGGALAEWEIWDLSTASPRLALVIHDAYLDAVAFHPDGKRIGASNIDRSVVFWDLATGQPVTRFEVTDPAFRLAFDPKGNRFAVVQHSRAGSLLTIHSGTDGLIESSILFTNQVNHLVWSPDGNWICAPDNSGKLTLIGTKLSERVVIGRQKSATTDVFFTPDGAYILSGGWSYEASFWDARARKRALAVPFQGQNLQMRVDGGAYSMETETGIQIFEIIEPVGFREFREDLGGRLHAAAFSSDGRWLAACGASRLSIWDLAGNADGTLTNGDQDVRLSFASNGELFVDQRGGCSRWQLHQAADPNSPPQLERLPLPTPSGFVSLSVWSNAVIMTGAKGSAIMPLNKFEQAPLTWKQTIEGLSHASQDGRWLGIYPSYSSELLIYKLPSLEPIARLSAGAKINEFAFSSTGDEIGIGTDTGVEFWSTSSWSRLRRSPQQNDLIYAPVIHGYWLKHERTSGFYDLSTGQALLPLPPGTVPLAASPDGRQVLLSLNGERLQLCDMLEIRNQLRKMNMDWAGPETSSPEKTP